MNHNLLDNIYQQKKHFFWTMIQKLDTKNIEISDLINRLNVVNSKFFKVIDNGCETLADPFLFKYDGEMYVFFEKINNERWIERLNEGTGEIYCSKLTDRDGKLCYSKPTLVLTERHHLSYPFIIEVNNEIYMLPEQKKNGKLELYQCVSFPDKWTPIKTLMKGNFIDSTIFYHNKLYWLFTVNVDKHNTVFKEQIYYATDLVTRKWTLHSTINESNKIDSRRGAGNIFIKNGKIYRPVQKNIDYYGQSTLLLEITKLTITEYEENIVGILNRNIHTFNMLDNWIVIDSHNLNKKFFETEYERSMTRWNSKMNRKIMTDKYYKEIGDLLRDKKSKNVLDIGINMFNIYNKSYFNNELINYHQLDVNVPVEIKEKLESTVLVDSIIELEKRRPEYVNYFDVIISYGVLGYIEFTAREIEQYLWTLYSLLKTDGKLYLKLDKKHMSDIFRPEHIVTEEHLSRYFISDNIEQSEVLKPLEEIEQNKLIDNKKENETDLSLNELTTLINTILKLCSATKKVEVTIKHKENVEKEIAKAELTEKLEIVKPDSVIETEFAFYVLKKK